MNTPENLLYTKDHEWAKIENDVATIGITDFAQNTLGDIVYLELPEVGTELAQGQAFGIVESIKSVSDLYAPVSGTIVERNSALIETPENINQDAYGAWFIKIKLKNQNETNSLVNDKDYKNICETAH